MTLEMCPSITFLLFSVVSLVFFEKISETLYRNRCFITKHLDVRRILTIFSVVESLSLVFDIHVLPTQIHTAYLNHRLRLLITPLSEHNTVFSPL